MKISECINAPEWLKQAETRDEDVEVLAWGWVIWKKGDFLGGNFLGGDFLGGNFLGGDFLGVPSNFAMSIGHAEEYTKVLVGSISGVAYIYAGCRWFTLAEAKKHWESKK